MASQSPQILVHDHDATAQGLRRLAVVGVTFALCGIATYALPHTQRLRPWVPGEGVPIARMFTDGASDLPGFAEAGMQAAPHGAGSQLTEQLGTQVAKNLGDAPESQDGQLGPGSEARERINADEYEGLEQHIEFPEALKLFFTKLAQVARRTPGALVRVAHYGDSAVAADAITSTARRRLQHRFGDGGHGFVLISRGSMHYGHKDVVQRSSSGWEVNSIVQLGLSPGYYGYGGVQAKGGGGETASFGTVKDGEIGTKVSRFELFYQRSRGAGTLEIKLDGKKQATLNARSNKPEDAFHVVETEDGPHLLSIKAQGGPSRLYGVALEREGPGVIYDSLGIVGAVAERLLGAQKDHIAAQIAHRDPELLVLAFGGNESANKWLNLEQYEKDLTRVVKLMRSGKPEMSCLLFAPLDQGERNARGRVVTVEVLPKIVATQRKVAQQEGCAFFDAFTAMGGEGAMGRWIKARPKLATSDLRHATPAGYEVVGNLYYKALLEAFATFLGKAR